MFLVFKGGYARLVTRDVDSLRCSGPLLRAEKRLLLHSGLRSACPR